MQLTPHSWDFRNPLANLFACCRATEGVSNSRQKRRECDGHESAVCVHQLSPLQQYARCRREICAYVFINCAESRDYIAQQKQGHQQSDAQQYGWIDTGVDESFTQRVRLLRVGDISCK